MTETLRGANETLLKEALESGDPLTGTTGFAGWVDGTLVRDVLGRVPLFVESSIADGKALSPDGWAFSPTPLDDPVAVPAGAKWTETDRQIGWSLPNPAPDTDADRALERVDRAITDATAEVSREGLAIAFSGGVDSALVAALLDRPLYVAGFPGSHDIEAATSAAAAMGRREALTLVEFEPEELAGAVPELVAATGRTNAMDIQIALPLYLTAKRAASDGYTHLAVGQGADELFGGYEKVARLDHRVAANSVREAVREQIHTLPAQLPRDVLALEAAGVSPVAPLLDDRVIDAALRLPESLLVSGESRKVGFRQVAEGYLPTEISSRQKKAVQYGSLAARELDRLARQAGYKRRMDGHVDQYIKSLL